MCLTFAMVKNLSNYINDESTPYNLQLFFACPLSCLPVGYIPKVGRLTVRGDYIMNNYRCFIGYRRCNVCGNTTVNMNKKTCDCGHFMYPIAQGYLPKVKPEKKVNP